MSWIEFIGIAATIFIIISMSCKTSNIKSAIMMRITNIIGSVVFIVYGILLPAISTAILNGIVTVINIYHLILLLKSKKQDK